MALNNIILRSTANAPLVTKFAELTYAELDNNFIQIYEYLTQMNNGSALEPWSVSTNYSGVRYVSYDGNIYKLIAASSTGEVPVSFPAVWELTSIGALVHIQGTDQALDLGGANEVTAPELFDVVNNQVISVTLVGFNTAVNNSLLIPNRIYKITNLVSAGFSGISQFEPTLYIYAVSNKSYDNIGLFTMLVPKSDAWNNFGVYSVGNVAQYDGYVYENLTGNNVNDQPPPADTVNWILRTNVSYYETKSFGNAKFTNLGGSIQLVTCEDEFGNVYSGNDIVTGQTLPNNNSYCNNICLDSSSSIGHLGRIANANEVCNNIFLNNSEVEIQYGASLGGTLQAFKNNYLDNSKIIINGDNVRGDIFNVHLTNTILELPDGLPQVELLANLKCDFGVQQSITIKGSIGAPISGHVSESGSTVASTYDITGVSPEFDPDGLNGRSDIVGDYQCIMTSGNERIAIITKIGSLFPIKVRCVTDSSTLEIETTPVGGLFEGAIVQGQYDLTIVGGVITLDGTYGDYVVLEPAYITGYKVWRVKEINVVA